MRILPQPSSQAGVVGQSRIVVPSYLQCINIAEVTFNQQEQRCLCNAGQGGEVSQVEDVMIDTTE